MYSRIKDGVENLIDVGILKEAHEAFHHKSTGLCVCVAPRQYTGTQQCIIIKIYAEAVVLIGCIGFYCVYT